MKKQDDSLTVKQHESDGGPDLYPQLKNPRRISVKTNLKKSTPVESLPDDPSNFDTSRQLIPDREEIQNLSNISPNLNHSKPLANIVNEQELAELNMNDPFSPQFKSQNRETSPNKD